MPEGPDASDLPDVDSDLVLLERQLLGEELRKPLASRREIVCSAL
jgi:hypothetical protein